MAKKGSIITIVAILLLGALFFITRFYNLSSIPIFTDEAIYLRWAQIGLSDPRWRFISLIDGKQPLFIWLLYPALKLTSTAWGMAHLGIFSDPLLAGRAVSIFMGFIALLGFGVSGKILTKSWKGALIAASIYLILPFYLLYDRFALYESIFAAIAVWTLCLSYLFGKYQRLDTALLLGSTIGFGLLTKSYANFYWYLLPLCGLFISWDKKNYKKQLAKFAGLMLIVIIQAQIYANIMRLSEFLHMVGRKNTEFIYSVSDLIAHPGLNLFGNIQGLGGWLIAYLTIPILIAVVAAFAYLISASKHRALGIFLLFHFVTPFAALALFGKVIYPRFLLFMSIPLMLGLSVALTSAVTYLKKQPLKLWGLMVLIFGYALFFDLKILTDPIRAPLPGADRNQFIVDWPAGYGVAEVVAFLRNEAADKQIVIGTEGTFGLYPMALELYLITNKNIQIKPYWPVTEVPPDLLTDAKTKPTYLVFKERQDIPPSWPLEPIAQYQRGDGNTYLKFYRVIPRP